MHKRYRYLIENESKVKVVARTEDNHLNRIKFPLLAAFFAGIFYFFGSNLWYALAGG